MSVAKDLDFVRSIIPYWYEVNESKEKKGSIHCCSTGTNKGMNEDQWESFKTDVSQWFGNDVQEFYHHVNADHQDFTIFLKVQ